MQALVQVRGPVDMSRDIQDTLEMLNIHSVNHCALVPETDTYSGMVAKVNDYVAFGEPSEAVLTDLIESRGEPASGAGDVDDAWVAEHTEYDDVADLAGALLAEETTLSDAGLAPVIRLHPPRGGHDGIKTPASDGGQLGKHTTEEIDHLLTDMR
ncbi:50S ribosomal protein L30 [Halobacterium salinarum]|uniref:Large ribosomal subunit protein uL30 n=5 Tax=Halobacterium salinarum TaxID=2242 RepID=RL30_HALSA|nr:50S ribosomal protein L30 [Halobacterium salinarum]B0R677.1 RecName: Full=Large ribosomal subunit protein uL30; AltName: Full=50S ribosomal protein L30 [Halobacterium salinarum R1]Q9HPB3.1 RecName: Full=Large ribosomal subunit protein uL30; AltName: Full=50S ribosomal protein L30 [Halobacterium salinarum NRC-1]AAG19957.1 50S ribosomal protein L30P [Halobacterium salinarum NRC-1]MBB6088963.1 large subunit ribosomal protein L30 [Halobacterium salinarum]MDL0118647.1 50S ribosomal protein L30 [